MTNTVADTIGWRPLADLGPRPQNGWAAPAAGLVHYSTNVIVLPKLCSKVGTSRLPVFSLIQ